MFFNSMPLHWSVRLSISAKLKNSKIGVLMGGDSSEREISLKSGKAVVKALKTAGLTVAGIDLTGNPRTRLKKENIDIAFIALHGKGGEDGKIQTILESMKIPYTGGNPKASQNAFDKWKAKKIFAEHNILTPRAFLVTKKNYKARIKDLRFPLFVKPVDQGSSIGVSLLNNRRTVDQDIAAAVNEYGKVILEDKVFGREITIGIIGDKALPIIELVPDGSFFDYDAKYKKDKTKYYVELHMQESDYKKYQAVALQVFSAVGLQDIARVDMIVDNLGDAYVLEVNSIPGMTERSLLPKAAEKIGMDFPHVCVDILQSALTKQ